MAGLLDIDVDRIRLVLDIELDVVASDLKSGVRSRVNRFLRHHLDVLAIVAGNVDAAIHVIDFKDFGSSAGREIQRSPYGFFFSRVDPPLSACGASRGKKSRSE